MAAARAGRFSKAIAQDLTTGRLMRFCTERPDGYQSEKALRDRMPYAVCRMPFARHDLIMAPPFTRLGIICSGKLMIGFRAALQQRLVPRFHDSLKPGGALMLGTSATAGRSQSLFGAQEDATRKPEGPCRPSAAGVSFAGQWRPSDTGTRLPARPSVRGRQSGVQQPSGQSDGR